MVLIYRLPLRGNWHGVAVTEGVITKRFYSDVISACVIYIFTPSVSFADTSLI